MTERQAGRVFLDTTCDLAPVLERFDRVVFRGRDRITYASLTGRMPEVRRVSGALSWALSRSARRLFNPPAAWPSEVDGLVDKLAVRHSDLAYWFDLMSDAATPREWGRYLDRARDVPAPRRVGLQIRARLGLPSEGGC